MASLDTGAHNLAVNILGGVMANVASATAAVRNFGRHFLGSKDELLFQEYW